MAFVNATPGGTQVRVAPPAPTRAPSNPAAGTYTNVPNPGNPAQQEINHPVPQQQGGAQTPAATQAQQPSQQPPMTAPAQDYIYYDTLARLNHSYQNAKAAYPYEVSNAEAGYNYTTQGLTQDLPQQIKAQLNRANARGILESGIAGQDVGNVQTAYGRRMGAANMKRGAAENAALNRWIAAQGNYDLGTTNALNASIGRQANRDLQSGAITTPQTTPPKPGSARAAILAAGTPAAGSPILPIAGQGVAGKLGRATVRSAKRSAAKKGAHR